MFFKHCKCLNFKRNVMMAKWALGLCKQKVELSRRLYFIQVRSYRLAINLGILTCYLLNILWSWAVLDVVPQSNQCPSTGSQSINSSISSGCGVPYNQTLLGWVDIWETKATCIGITVFRVVLYWQTNYIIFLSREHYFTVFLKRSWWIAFLKGSW